MRTPILGMPSAELALLAVAYLMVKHAAGDYFLQTATQHQQKGDYGATGGITHSLTHVLLTAPVFLLLPRIPTGLAAALLAVEFVLHYHIDWIKEQAVRRNGWTPENPAYWRAIGFDQLLHGLTYIAILLAAFDAAG